jgi:hypothetical protein
VAERDIMHAIRAALGADPRVVLWRNDVGAGERKVSASKTIHTRYGLAVGSSDLVGIVRVPLAHPIGPTTYLGRFIGLEVKTDVGRTTADQDLFLSLVRRYGGFACVVRSVPDALAAVDRCISGGSE